MRVFGQLFITDATCRLMSLAPMSISESAGYFTAYVFMLRPPILELSELMNALPSVPGPDDSNRPRAKTTSTSAQLAAAADRAAPGVPGGRRTAANSDAAAVAITAR